MASVNPPEDWVGQWAGLTCEWRGCEERPTWLSKWCAVHHQWFKEGRRSPLKEV